MGCGDMNTRSQAVGTTAILIMLLIVRCWWLGAAVMASEVDE
jgi:hypothetical protein